MEQFFQGRNKIFRKNVPGTKIFSENFVPPEQISPEQNSSDSTIHPTVDRHEFTWSDK